MNDAIAVLGISGSLRKASFNTALLRAAIHLAPDGIRIETAEIGAIPMYNDDVRTVALPEPVVRLRDQIARADALLIVTPEYNYSIPGVLKNAIDWASRPPKQPFAGKPLGMMGASGGPGGTVRAQYHLRQMAVFLDMHAINKPELFVRNAQTMFDDAGELRDDELRQLVRQYLDALADWTRRIRPSTSPR
jgi:chromate reductase, NAD(P)H dehydrogenase (quinone)